MGQNSGKNEYTLLQGTGGVSIAGLLWAKASGAKGIALGNRREACHKDTDLQTVVITSSSNEKLARAKELGADFGVNYKGRPEWENFVMEVTNGHGADIILETGGSQTLAKSFACAATMA